MAITKFCPVVVLLLAAGHAWSREAATPAQCQTLAQQAPLSGALANARNLGDVRAQMALADLWNDAGCYNEAVAQLQNAVNVNPGVPELQTRLRIARSLVGEEHFFDDLDRADNKARVKRDAFRCNNLADLDACNEAVRLQPDDAAPLIALGDALMRAKRPSEALQQYRRAESLATDKQALDKQALVQKMHVAESQLPIESPQTASAGSNSTDARVVRATPEPAPRRYSNASPQGQSH